MKRTLNRIISLFLTFCFVLVFAICSLSGNISAKALNFTPDFGINSDSAIVYSLDSGDIIYQKNQEKKQIPAQLIQIMAAVICLENCDDIDGTLITANNSLYDEFYIYGNEYGYDDLRYAQIYNGDKLSVTELLYAMLLTSSVEASVILSNYFGDGSTNVFADKMNAKAAEIGCTNTHFTNATGLYDENQYSTASDMLKITQYALKVPRFEEIATAQSYTPTIRESKNHTSGDWYWSNANTMMAEKSSYYYEGAKGIKTGNLEQAGRNLIMMCSKSGKNFLLILMNAPFTDGDGELQYYHLIDAEKLLDWCYNNFDYTSIIKEDDEVAEIPVSLAKGDGYVLVHAEKTYTEMWCTDVDTSAIQREINLYDNVSAPVGKGEKLGTIKLTYNGEEITTLNLVAVSSVKRSPIKYFTHALINYPNSIFMKLSIIAASVITVLYLLICIWSYSNFLNNSKPQEPVHIITRVEKGAGKAPKKKKNPPKDVYKAPEDKRYNAKPIKPVDIKYDDKDFRH